MNDTKHLWNVGGVVNTLEIRVTPLVCWAYSQRYQRYEDAVGLIL